MYVKENLNRKKYASSETNKKSRLKLSLVSSTWRLKSQLNLIKIRYTRWKFFLLVENSQIRWKSHKNAVHTNLYPAGIYLLKVNNRNTNIYCQL